MALGGGGKIYESMEKHLVKMKFDAKLFLVTTIITKVPFGNFVNKYMSCLALAHFAQSICFG
jgi:hypothetical protein